jgi:hypothetical protein
MASNPVAYTEHQQSDKQAMPGSFYWNHSNSDLLRIESIDGESFRMQHKWGEKWSHYGTYTAAELAKKCVFVGNSEADAEAYFERAKSILETGEGLNMITALQMHEEPSSELMQQGDRVRALEKRALDIAEKSMVIQLQMKVAMQIKEAEMKAMMQAANAEIDKVFKYVEKVQKIIRSLELYAGVNEEMVQISEGGAADEKMPLVIRQAVVFMDEEVGQWREGGFDYSNVEDFDEWLKTPANLIRVAPEQKCIVAFRPRRREKDYGDDKWKSEKNIWNKQTYFLIRNGGNLYRIFTENLQLGTKVFLSPSDLQKTADAGLTENEKDLFTRQALFIQGLIDRSEVFNPHPEGINIFNPETYQGWLQLVYDMDGVLTDGRLAWKDWKAQVNSALGAGSRVIIASGWLGDHWKDRQWTMNERCKRYYSSDYNLPSSPDGGGLFIAEQGFDMHGRYRESWPLSFRYAPGGEGWSWSGYYERKNKITFGFDPASDQVLNYDGISLDDVEYYLNDRVQRQHYANMLPLLERIRVERLAEIEQEKDFVALIAHQNGVDEQTVWALVEWWKTKNKWKRPIRNDDTLALRMISKRLGQKHQTAL